MNSSKKVDIVIVTYNNWAATKLFLESVEKYTNSDLYEITCVDNGSTDETLKQIENFNNINLVKNKKNLGYGKAVNIGIKNSGNKYLAILNNDLIVSLNWLEKWLEIFKNTDFSVLTTNSNTISKFDKWIEFKKQNPDLKLDELFKKYYKNYESPRVPLRFTHGIFS